mgnify:CR=1 FL=1
MNKEGTQIKSPVLYLQHHYELLKLEYEYEKEQFQQQTELMGIGRKIKRGMCWYPLSLGRSYYNALNQLVIEVERKEDKEIEHLFEYGKPVCFFTQDMSGKLTYLNFVATVNYVEEDRMVVILPDANALLTLQSKEVVGVQLYFDETSYRLMFEALKQVISAKNNRLAELRDIFHGTQPVSTFSFQPVRFPWLNATQDEAVNKVLHAKDVAIVHGPPGTGKTTTLVEAIYETLHRENQVLVCAQSNMAVDWISDKLFDRQYPALAERYKDAGVFGPTLIASILYMITSGCTASTQYAYAEMLRLSTEGKINFVEDTREYARRAERMKKIFTDNGFHIVYDYDATQVVGDGFFFTIGYGKMKGGELLRELLYYGVSSISLSTTGSEQEGVRACTSRMREELYPVMEERMKAFHEDHP